MPASDYPISEVYIAPDYSPIVYYVPVAGRD